MILYCTAKDFTCKFIPQYLQVRLQGRRRAAVVFRFPKNHLRNGIKPLFLILFFLTILKAKEQNPLEISARSFKKAPQDKGFRRILGEINKEKPDSFWLFLEQYTEAKSRKDQFKIMRNYYENYSESKFRLPALMFLYNSIDPWNRIHDKEVFDFLNQHLYESHVLSLFLFRWASYKQQLSFHQLLLKLLDKVSDFNLVTLEALHLVDWMLFSEMNEKNQTQIRTMLIRVWKNEITRQTPIYLDNRSWFHRVLGFYNLRQSSNNFLPLGITDFKEAKVRLFTRYGYDFDSVMTKLEKEFQIAKEALELPDFMPTKE